jgi:RimJ/RimL family protein N-acetyltransferase
MCDNQIMTKPLKTINSQLVLVSPDPDRDAPFAHEWFSGESGRDTLLNMGNAHSEIKPSSLEDEREVIEEFLRLERDNTQLTWMLRYDGRTVGAAWIDVIENHGVKAPSVHLLVGDTSMRGKGLGKAAMLGLIQYVQDTIKTKYVYSRHLTSNVSVRALNQSVGFIDDGSSYVDENELEWQNIKLKL